MFAPMPRARVRTATEANLRVAEDPHGVLKIPGDAFDLRLPPDLAHAVLYTVDANESQFESRATSGLLAAHSATHLLVDGGLHERLQLGVQFLVAIPRRKRARMPFESRERGRMSRLLFGARG